MVRSSSDKTSRSGGRINWGLWIITVLLSATVIAGLAWLFSGGLRQKPELVLPVNNALELRLEAVLTAENGKFDSRPVSTIWLEKLPDFVQSLLPNRRTSKGHSFTMSLERGAMGLLFRAGYRPERAMGRSSKDASDELFNLTNGGQPVYLQLKLAEGAYLSARPVYRMYSGTDGVGTYSIPFDSVPLGLETLQVEVVEQPYSPERRVVHSELWRNPLYRMVEPLVASQKPPVTVTHDGVSVILKNFVAKTVEPDKNRKDAHGNDDYPDLKSGLFLRAAGTVDDQYYGAAVFEISEAGTSQTQWGIAEVNFHYGKELLPVKLGRTSIGKVLGGNGEQLYICSYAADLDLLAQPVRLTLELERIDDFQPDERQTVSLDLPPKGTMHPGVQVPLWSGPAVLTVSNHRDIDEPFGLYVEDKMAIAATGLKTRTSFIDPYLEGPGGKRASLEDKHYGGSTMDNAVAVTYDIENLTYNRKSPPIDLSEYTTVTVTVLSPRRMEKTFEFVATPVDAAVPAVAKE